MKENTIAASEEELAQLVFEAQTTIAKMPGATGDVFERVRRFIRLYSELRRKPVGAALLYEDGAPSAPSYHELTGKLVVGRLSKSAANPDASDLAAPDAQMSRTHFQITLADGFYVLRDLDSRNGTYLNNIPTRIEETVLKAGDIILAGASLFIFTGAPFTSAP